MKNIILVLALVSSFYLNAQTGRKSPNCNYSKAVQSHTICHVSNTPKDNGVPPGTVANRVCHEQVEHTRAAKMIDYIRVYYCMRDESRQSRDFMSTSAANTFITDSLASNTVCTYYYVKKVPL